MRNVFLVILIAWPTPALAGELRDPATTTRPSRLFAASEFGVGTSFEPTSNYRAEEIRRGFSFHGTATLGLRFPVNAKLRLGPTVAVDVWAMQRIQGIMYYAARVGARGWHELRPGRYLDVSLEYQFGIVRGGEQPQGIALAAGYGSDTAGARLHIDLLRYHVVDATLGPRSWGPNVNIWVSVDLRQRWSWVILLLGSIAVLDANVSRHS